MASKKHKRVRRKTQVDELNLTPMIDVVFQLLVYFVVTFEIPDVLTHLDITKPQPDPDKPPDAQPPPPLVKITIYAGHAPDKGRYTFNDREVSLERLETILASVAEQSKTQTIMLMATANSPHGALIAVQNLCKKVGLESTALISTN